MSTTNTKTDKTKTTQQPADKVRHGNVHATIWKNVNAEGKAWYSTTVQRTFKDKKGKWRPTDSFSRDDLLIVSEVATAAYNRIRELEAQDREAAKAEQ